MSVKVIRVILYEGDETAVREAIRLSLPLGFKDCKSYAITIGEHLNELPELVELAHSEVMAALESKNETDD